MPSLPHIGDNAARNTKTIDDEMSQDRPYAKGELEKLQNERRKSSAVEWDAAEGRKNTHRLLRKHRPLESE
jgi:hypothetical protein